MPSITPASRPTPDGSPGPLRTRGLVRMYWKSIVAVLTGNFVYFVLLWSWLPPHARHRRNQVDLGLLIDFWICVFVWGLLEFVFRRRKETSRAGSGERK